MTLPRRHAFRVREGSDELFRRLPAGMRFRFSPPDGPEVFGADPVRTLSPAGSRDDSPLLVNALRDALPRVPTASRDALGAGRFAGGAVGMVTYEAGHPLEDGPTPPEDAGPSAWFGVYDTFAVHDPVAGRVEVVSWGLQADGTFDEREALRRAGDLEERLRDATAEEPPDDEARRGAVGTVRVSLDAASHARAVESILEHIRGGDIYQANLTARFDVPTGLSALQLHERLRRDNPSPHAAYLETGDGEIVSCSPERLLAARGRELITEPIKGTAFRDADAREDARRARELLASDKDRAELLMITDLLRNDLGKVCAPGSIRVAHLRRLRSFPHLHHLVSTIHGRLRPDLDVFDALEAVFPCGSITGAPKRRAMQILRELEPTPRGVYTGAVGWVGFDRSADFSVAIRTGRHAGGVFSFGAGGGIVIDSTPEAEWRELWLKARAFLLALGCDAAATSEART